MADSKTLLTYFDGRGLAEAARIALSAAQIKFDEVYLRSKDEFLQLIKDGKLLFKQVPLLEIDGETLVGSEPIVRYVCRKGKLEGKTETDQAKIEMLAMGARDMLKGGLVGAKFQGTPQAQEDMLQKGLKQGVERYLPVFEKVLSESKSGFLVGDSLSMADIFLFDAITYLSDDPALKPKLAVFPKCTAFIEYFSQQPGIKEYMSSPSRHPLPDDAYVQEVMKVLH